MSLPPDARGAIPAVQDGRLNRDLVKKHYGLDFTASRGTLALLAYTYTDTKRLIEVDLDVLCLLKQAVTPNVQAK